MAERKKRSTHLLNALISQYQAAMGRRVTHRSIADVIQVLPSTLSKWTMGKSDLDQIECLLKLASLVDEDTRWISEFRKAIEMPAIKRKEKKPRGRSVPNNKASSLRKRRRRASQ